MTDNSKVNTDVTLATDKAELTSRLGDVHDENLDIENPPLDSSRKRVSDGLAREEKKMEDGEQENRTIPVELSASKVLNNPDSSPLDDSKNNDKSTSLFSKVMKENDELKKELQKLKREINSIKSAGDTQEVNGIFTVNKSESHKNMSSPPPPGRFAAVKFFLKESIFGTNYTYSSAPIVNEFSIDSDTDVDDNGDDTPPDISDGDIAVKKHRSNNAPDTLSSNISRYMNGKGRSYDYDSLKNAEEEGTISTAYDEKKAKENMQRFDVEQMDGSEWLPEDGDAMSDGGDSCHSIFDTMPFHKQMIDRASWLIGLLVFQSLSSFILKNNEDMLQEHLDIVHFLTMLVGAGGNAGNQACVRVIRGLAVGNLNNRTMKNYIWTEAKMTFSLGIILAVTGLVRAAMFHVPFPETIAITASLWMIVVLSIILGAVLPLSMKFVGIDPAHSSTTIQVVMDILGVTLTCKVSRFILDSSTGQDIVSMFTKLRG